MWVDVVDKHNLKLKQYVVITTGAIIQMQTRSRKSLVCFQNNPNVEFALAYTQHIHQTKRKYGNISVRKYPQITIISSGGQTLTNGNEELLLPTKQTNALTNKLNVASSMDVQVNLKPKFETVLQAILSASERFSRNPRGAVAH